MSYLRLRPAREYQRVLLADCQQGWRGGVGVGGMLHTRLWSEWKLGTHWCVPLLNRVCQLALCTHHMVYQSDSDAM